jgi:hypothetical protein
LSRGNIKDSKKILLPYFLQIDTEVMDCPYLLSCHFLSTVLLHYHFADFLSTDQIQKAAIQFIKTAEYKNTCYDDVDALKIKGHVQIISTVDPDLLCWRNFHLCYLFAFWLCRKKVKQLPPFQVKLRRRLWYYVIIFLRERRSVYLLELDSLYLKSPTVDHAYQKTQEFKKFAKKMTNLAMDTMEGLDNAHWNDLRIYTSQMSSSDDDPTANEYPTDPLPPVISTKVKSKSSRSTATPTSETPPSYGSLLREQLTSSNKQDYRLLQMLIIERNDLRNQAADIAEKINMFDAEILLLSTSMVADFNDLKDLMEHQ